VDERGHQERRHGPGWDVHACKCTVCMPALYGQTREQDRARAQRAQPERDPANGHGRTPTNPPYGPQGHAERSGRADPKAVYGSRTFNAPTSILARSRKPVRAPEVGGCSAPCGGDVGA
jgi:hypothetical protein